MGSGWPAKAQKLKARLQKECFIVHIPNKKPASSRNSTQSEFGRRLASHVITAAHDICNIVWVV